MEGRRANGLWLETTDVAADDASGRACELLEDPRVRHVSWWENLRAPGVQALPRRRPRGSLLVLAEVDDDFRPPPVPADRGVHLRRYPRPAQGHGTGRPTLGLLLVLIGPRHAGEEQALRDWGDFVHLRLIAEAAVPGYTTITAWEHATGGEPRYCHLYEMDAEDPVAAYEAMTPLVTRRLGGADTEAWARWATCPQLAIHAVDVWGRLGVAATT